MAKWADRILNQTKNTDRRSTGDPDVINPYGSEVAQGEAPREELVPAPVFPYRGLENHGVDTQRPAVLDQPEDFEFADGKFAEPAEDIQPLPVRIVRESSDEYRAFRMAQFPVTTLVTRILGRDRTRQKFQLTHAGPTNDPMYLGHDMNLTPTSGWILYQGQSVTVESSEPLYAVATYSPNGLTAMISQEYIVNPLDQNQNMSREAQVPRRRR